MLTPMERIRRIIYLSQELEEIADELPEEDEHFAIERRATEIREHVIMLKRELNLEAEEK